MTALTGWWKLTRRDGTTFVVDDTELKRLRGLKRPGFVSSEPARLHICSVCQTRGPWTESWGWYGSWKDIDEGRPVKKFCSDECRGKRKEFAGHEEE